MKREQLIKRALQRLGSEAIQRLRTSLTADPYYKGGLRASGNLQDSMYYTIADDAIEIFMADYAKTVDEGRRRFAKTPKGFARDIERWMNFKGISPQKKTIRESARAIANSIYERGAIQRFGYSGSNFIDRAINNVLNEFDDDLLTAWMSGLEEELNKIK
jgi:hypothetical protein